LNARSFSCAVASQFIIVIPNRLQSVRDLLFSLRADYCCGAEEQDEFLATATVCRNLEKQIPRRAELHPKKRKSGAFWGPRLARLVMTKYKRPATAHLKVRPFKSGSNPTFSASL
jgi:hypothetical protein